MATFNALGEWGLTVGASSFLDIMLSGMKNRA